jgi:hypothetical protein
VGGQIGGVDISGDVIAAEARRQAIRLESRAVETEDENDMRAATLLRLLLGFLRDEAADDTAGHSIN